MIERHHYLKLKEEHATPGGREEVARRSQAALGAVPGVRHVTIGLPADDEAAASWDLSITIGFDSLAEVARYRSHPDHRRFVDDFLAERIEVKKNWNFQVYEG